MKKKRSLKGTRPILPIPTTPPSYKQITRKIFTDYKNYMQFQQSTKMGAAKLFRLQTNTTVRRYKNIFLATCINRLSSDAVTNQHDRLWRVDLNSFLRGDPCYDWRHRFVSVAYRWVQIQYEMLECESTDTVVKNYSGFVLTDDWFLRLASPCRISLSCGKGDSISSYEMKDLNSIGSFYSFHFQLKTNINDKYSDEGPVAANCRNKTTRKN